MKKKVIYGFSGDPITKGHIDVIKRALAVFGELIVGIGMNPAKKYFLSLEERRILAEESLKSFENIEVISFRGLLVDYAYENGINTVIRGIRNNEDLNYEVMLYQIGKSQQLNIDTIFFPSSQELMHISSGASKALQLEQGLIHEYVPLCVKQKLEQKLSSQCIISITGLIGSGKSFISEKFIEIAKSANIEAYVVDIDQIGHQILGSLEQPLYVELRNKIASKFGKDLMQENGFINRKSLGKILFNNKKLLDEFNLLIYKPLLLRLRREIYGKKGFILLDSALIAESEMGYLSNNNIILVEVDKKTQNTRLNNRGYSTKQIENRLNSQYTFELKEKMILDSITRDDHGTLWKINNSKNDNEEAIRNLFFHIAKTFDINKEDF